MSKYKLTKEQEKSLRIIYEGQARINEIISGMLPQYYCARSQEVSLEEFKETYPCKDNLDE